MSGIQASGSTISTPYLNGEVNGHTFVGWEVDGVRMASADGVFIQKLSVQPGADTTLLARYTLTSQDADADGLPDWYEHRYFGDLLHDGASDPDGNGYDIATELRLGLSPAHVDDVRDGGVAARASLPTTFAVGKSLYTVDSIPIGLMTPASEYVDHGVTRTTDYFGPGNYSGMRFGYWTVNGVRIAAANGVAQRQVSLTVTGTTRVQAHFFAPGTDTDGDGIADASEWLHFGGLQFDRDSDPDGDGSSIGLELGLG